MLRNKGQIGFWTIGLLLIQIIIVGYLCYVQFNKKNEINKFKDNAQQVIDTKTDVVKRYQLFEFAFAPFTWSGCGVPLRNVPNKSEVSQEVAQDVKDADQERVTRAVNTIVNMTQE